MTLNVTIDINGHQIGKMQISRMEEIYPYVFRYKAKVAFDKGRTKEFDVEHKYDEGAEKLIYLAMKKYLNA